MSDIDNYLDQSTFAARVANAGAQDDDPDQAARAIELSDATGDPATAIYGDVDGYEKAHKAALGGQIISDNQFIAGWLNSHPMAPRVAHDDLGALDDVSQNLQGLKQESGLKGWLKSNTIQQSFMEGWGEQPLSPEGYAHFYGNLTRPDEVSWMISHPGARPFVVALGLGEIGVEALSRSFGGLINVSKDALSHVVGEGMAKELADMAQYEMTRGDIGIKGGGGGLEIKDTGLAKNAELIGKMRDAVSLAEPWTKIDKEPPPGLHPIIDDAKKTQAQNDITALEDSLTKATRSATRERAPDLFASLMRDHIANREIGIDPEAVRNLYGDSDPTPDDGKLGFVQDLKSQLEAAEVTGGDVRVPLADWLAKVDPEVAKGLHDDIRVRDNGLTVNETKIEAEPKEVIPDNVAMIRGAGGFEPQFMAGDRKVTLERKVQKGIDERYPDELARDDGRDWNELTSAQRAEYQRRSDEGRGAALNQKSLYDQGFHDVDIKDENGNTVGTINLSEQKGGKQLYIEMIQAGAKENGFYQPNYLGPATIRDMHRQLKAMFPNAESITGHRVSGAREKAGTYLTDSASPVVKLHVPDEGESNYTLKLKEHTPQTGQFEYGIHDKLGKEIGFLLAGEQNEGRRLHIFNIEANEGETYKDKANTIGPVKIRDLLGQLKQLHPKAEELSGYRISGARREAGVDDDVIKHPVVKLQVPDGWSQIEPMRDLLNNFWQQIPNVQAEGLRGATTLDEQALSEAVRRELQRIVPAKVGSVDTPISIRRRTAEGPGAQLGGFHQRFMDKFPTIAVALDAANSLAGALGIARHEAIHHLRSYGFFKPEEWATLVQAAKDNGWLDKYGINRRYPNLNDEAKLEEAIAEGYRHWVAGERSKPEVDGIFAKLKEFFDNIKTHFKELTGRDLDWDEIFKKVDTGEVGSREGTEAIKQDGRTPFDRKDMSVEQLRSAANDNYLTEEEREMVEDHLQAMRSGKAAVDKITEADADEWSKIVQKIIDQEGFKPSEMAVEEPEGSEEAFGIYDRGKALGVTQSHMDRMLSLIQKRNAEDLEAANRRAEVRQRRRSNKEFKERRTALRDDVSNELQQRPDIALDRLFSRQKVKFNPAYLTEDQRARLPKEYIQKKDGINPDDLAPYFGYTSGDALVERLGMLTEDRRRVGLSQRDYFNRLVDVETDRRLNAEFGDREQNVLDEAKDQALSETQLNLVHEETMAYAYKAHGEDFVPQFTKDQVRDMVKSVFNDTPVGSISSDRMIQTAGKIGKKIEEAGSKGDWATAYRLSQQRNHAMIAAKFAREAERQKAQLDRTAKQMRKREVASIPTEYLNHVHDLLQRTGYPINRSIQDLNENIARQPETNLRDFKEAKEAQWLGVRELPIADYLMDPNFRMAVDKLSYHDFMGLKVSIDSLVKAGRDEKKVYVEGEAHDRKQTLDDAIEKLSTFGYSPSKATPSAFQQAIRLPIYAMLSKETTFNRWDRGDPLGLFNRLFSYPLAKADNGKVALERDMAKTYHNIPKPQDLDKLVDAPFPDPLTRTPENPQGDGPWAGFNRGNVLQLLHNVGNASNRNVVARGYGISPDELMQYLFKNTTKEDWDRAQQLGDNMWTKLISAADRLYERMTGATIEKIKLEPIDTPFGQYKGWYYPLDADPVRKTVWVQDPDTGLWSQNAQGKRDTINDSNTFHMTTNNGYTKKRTGAIYPLNLDFNMTPTRINQMIHDINYKEVIHETQKTLLDPRFKEAVAKYYGKEYADGLRPYLDRLANGASIDSVNHAKAAQVSNYLRGNLIGTYIGYNPFTVMKHGPTALVMSMREVGAKNFGEAVKDLFVRSPEVRKNANDIIKANAEEVSRRERHWQDSVGAQGKIVADGNDREKSLQMGAAAVAWSDMVSAKPTWWASYNNARAKDLSHGASIDLAERSVRRAHGSTAATNLPPGVAGAGDILHPWLTSVYGFFGTAMQRRIETAYKLNDAYHLMSDREFKAASAKAWSAFGDFMTYMVWPTIVEELVTGIGTDDHRSWGMRAISGLTMGAASSVLYLRDLVHGMVSGHEPGVGMISSGMHDLGNVFRDFAHGHDALNRQHAGKTIGDLLTVTGEATGKMPKIVGNTVKYGINVATGKEKPKSVADVLLGVTKGSQKRREVK